MTDNSTGRWRKSRRSADNDQCVEFWHQLNAIRNSRNPDEVLGFERPDQVLMLIQKVKKAPTL